MNGGRGGGGGASKIIDFFLTVHSAAKMAEA